MKSLILHKFACKILPLQLCLFSVFLFAVPFQSTTSSALSIGFCGDFPENTTTPQNSTRSSPPLRISSEAPPEILAEFDRLRWCFVIVTDRTKAHPKAESPPHLNVCLVVIVVPCPFSLQFFFPHGKGWWKGSGKVWVTTPACPTVLIFNVNISRWEKRVFSGSKAGYGIWMEQEWECSIQNEQMITWKNMPFKLRW